jgi:SAM-dependent methyltransferase
MMKDYLEHTFSSEDVELVSIIDELPLWSAPFGLQLLDTVELKPHINALDVGCGLGFPLIELAQRLGVSSKVYGIDPWKRALERAHVKIGKLRM